MSGIQHVNVARTLELDVKDMVRNRNRNEFSRNPRQGHRDAVIRGLRSSNLGHLFQVWRPEKGQCLLAEGQPARSEGSPKQYSSSISRIYKVCLITLETVRL
jgi:hypothetical protein